MFRGKLEKIKENLKKNEGENNKKTIENLIVFVVLLIITIVAINYIWSGNKKSNKTINDENKKLAVIENNTQNKENTSNNLNNNNDIELRLENILSNIKGVGNVKVLVTYMKTSQVIPMYNEDSSSSVTEEKDSGGGTRTVNENSSKKDIIYEETNGVKTPITQSVINPQIEGAIVTAQGAGNADVKTNIVQAVEAVTGLATYKIQVFEME